MAIVHLMIFGNFLPRVYAMAFRAFFPCGGDMGFSLACLVQWYIHMSQLRRSEKTKDILYAVHLATAVSATLLFVAIIGNKFELPSLGFYFQFVVMFFQGALGWKKALKTIEKDKKIAENNELAMKEKSL